MGPDELADIEADFLDIQSRLPVRKGADVDAQGRTAIGVGHQGLNLVWAKPLSDRKSKQSQTVANFTAENYR